jgi:hypothetical protein
MAKTANMVLRSLFVPPHVDEQLREAAFRQGVTKGSLMRHFIEHGLAEYRERGELSISKEIRSFEEMDEADRREELESLRARLKKQEG